MEIGQRSWKIDRHTPGTPQVIRRLNRLQVLAAIRDHGPASRVKISTITGLSKVTVNQVAVDLLAAGVVTEELESEQSRPGRPGPRAKILSFHGNHAHVVGIDVGAAKALVLVADLSGQRLAECRVSTRRARSRRQLLSLLRTAVNTALDRAGISTGDVNAVAIGTPGIIDPDSSTIDLAPQLPDWEGIDPASELGMFDHCPVMVDNEVHLAVLGEQWKGAAQGATAAAFLYIGVGVGLGVVVGGELHRGASGAAGEVGYLPVDPIDDPARPPETGRFEWLVGGPAYSRAAAAAIEQGRAARILELVDGQLDAIDAAVVYRAAQEGDPDAAGIVSDILNITARGVASIVAVLNPARFIIGGGVSGAGSAILDPLAEKVARLVPRPPEFAVSSLGDEAVAIGALRRAIERCEAELFSLSP